MEASGAGGLHTSALSYGVEGASGAVLLCHLHLVEAHRGTSGVPPDQGHEAASVRLPVRESRICKD